MAFYYLGGWICPKIVINIKCFILCLIITDKMQKSFIFTLPLWNRAKLQEFEVSAAYRGELM